MSKYASITLSFDHFHFHPTAQLVPDLILTLCQTKIAERESFYHSDFLSSRKFIICQFLFLFSKLGKGILDFSFSSRNWRKEFRFLFLLSKLGKKIRDFSFSSRDEAKEFGFLFLLSNVEKLFLNFSFSSRLGFFASRQ